MAPTDPAGPGTDAVVADRAEPGAGPQQPTPHGTESLSADLETRGPRVSTRALVYAVGVIAVLVLISGVVALVVLHSPRLSPVPVPSVSAVS